MEIVVLESDEGVRELLREVFKLDGRDIICASTEEECVSAIADRKPDCGVLMLDVDSCDDANALALEMQSRNSNLTVLFTGKFAPTVSDSPYIISKPYDIEDLLARVEFLLAQAQSSTNAVQA